MWTDVYKWKKKTKVFVHNDRMIRNQNHSIVNLRQEVKKNFELLNKGKSHFKWFHLS